MTNASAQIRRAADLLTIAIFLATVALPLGGYLFEWTGTVGIEQPERTAAQPRAARGFAALLSVPSEFDHHFGKRYGFRDRLIRWNNIVTVLGLRAVPTAVVGPPDDSPGSDLLSRRVQRGKDGWFFYFGPNMMDSHRGRMRMKPDELEAWRRLLQARRAWLRRHGVDYLFVIAPEKQSIYPEQLPDYVRSVGPATDTDLFVEYMRRHSNVEVLDLRDALRTARRGGLTYYRTGTHWNEYGAHAAYRAILERLAVKYPAIRPRPLSAFEVERSVGKGDGFLRALGIQDLVDDEQVRLVSREPLAARCPASAADCSEPYEIGSVAIRETDRPELPRALFFHDSFARTHLYELLAEHFERSSFVWGRFASVAVLDERPDVVVEIRAERYFNGYGRTEVEKLMTR